MRIPNFIPRNVRIIKALMMREMITRFGREGFGFLWLIGEPLMFCGGVLILWSLIKPAYEHGVRLGPFVMTGYMCLLLMRHQIGYAQNAVRSNIGILYHRRVQVVHILLSRCYLEFLGSTAAFVVVYFVLGLLGQVGPPHNFLLLLCGWILVSFVASGVGFVLAGLSMRWEVFERITPVLTYALIPVSGAFFMTAWLPPHAREIYLLLPFAHGVEMVRSGVFGEFVETHYNVVYASAIGLSLNVLGLLLMADARDRIDEH